jgi:hypothetical protein
MNFEIRIKDINHLSLTDVTTIYSRLSHPNSGSDSSIRPELEKRYTRPSPGPHPTMWLAMVWQNGLFVSWVGTRPWPEKFKGETVTAQTIECFTDPDCRRHGLARLGLQALISAGLLDRNRIVSVYSPDALPLARSCGCKTVILCETTK